MGVVLVHPAAVLTGRDQTAAAGIPVQDSPGVRVILMGDAEHFVHHGDLIGMDDGLAGEAIQQIQLHLPAQPLFPSLAGVILPYRAGHHVLSAESRHDVDEDIRHRAQVVDGPICRTAQAEGVGEVVPPHPDV